MCKALPGLHAFTGCDYTAALMRKGKVCMLAMVEKSKKFQEAFGQLGESRRVSSVTMTTLETSVCHIYGKPGILSVNKARYELFQQHYAPKRRSKPLAKIKGADSSQLPPCYSVLVQKVRRANLVAGIWKHAILPDPCAVDPLESGWILKDGQYKINWFEGEEVPDDISLVLGQEIYFTSLITCLMFI